MGQARTGTGKTAAFCIPILERLEPRKRRRPTRRRWSWCPPASWPSRSATSASSWPPAARFTSVAVYGGKPIRQQVEQLRRGAEIVVGTPGRVIDLIGRGSLVLGDIRFVVLDEADRMLDIGFRPDIEKILRRCPQSRQTLLLSATIPPPVKRLAERYMRDPGDGRFLDQGPGGRDDRAVVLHGRSRAEVRSAGEAAGAREAAAGDRLLPHQARAPTRSCRRLAEEVQGRRHDPRRPASNRPATA